jgi:DNA-binding transcriptional LysR family regulator
MELRHLRYFVVLSEELHFGRAALRLGMSQPPLSQQIQQLERSLNARLFERTNRRVELTDAGRAFLREARATLAQAERAVAVVGHAERGEIGEIRIGFMPSAPLIAPFTRTVLAFRRDFPGVRLILQEEVTTQQIDALVEGRLQIGFIRSPGAPELPEAIAAVEVSREPLVAFMRADHPLARGRGRPLPLASLAAEPFVFFPRGSGTSLYDQVMELCRKAGFHPRIEQEARGNATILGLVAAGLGISILPSALRGIAVTNVVSRPLTAKGTNTSVYLVHRRHDPSPLIRTFVAMATSRRPPAHARRTSHRHHALGN